MVLEVQDLSKRYRNGRGIKDINFSIASGEILGLLGPNGSGKTTTMKAIAGLVNRNSGTINICGMNTDERHEQTLAQTGCLIEMPALYNHMTAIGNLRMAASYYKNIYKDKIMATLKLCGMEGYSRDKVGSFSLGMRQRIGLALALISDPKLLILDEPANGMDIEGMVDIREIIKTRAAAGSAVLVSSHLAHEIELTAGKVGIMSNGELLRVVSMEEALSESPTLEDYYLAQVAKFRKEGIS